MGAQPGWQHGSSSGANAFAAHPARMRAGKSLKLYRFLIRRKNRDSGYLDSSFFLKRGGIKCLSPFTVTRHGAGQSIAASSPGLAAFPKMQKRRVESEPVPLPSRNAGRIPEPRAAFDAQEKAGCVNSFCRLVVYFTRTALTALLRAFQVKPRSGSGSCASKT